MFSCVMFFHATSYYRSCNSKDNFPQQLTNGEFMKLHQHFDSNTAEYVVLHAQYRAKRGKRPSCSFNGVNNPREALKAANVELAQPRIHL
jgi:hypothetical protein